MLEIATMDTWWELSGRYPWFRRESHNLLKDFGYMRLIDAFDTLKPKRMLEFGHGFNAMLLGYAQDKCEAYGVDDHQNLCYFPPKDEWDQRYQDKLVNPFPRVNWVRGLLGTHQLTELAEGSFDMIASVSVLEEIRFRDMLPILEHCRRLLAPGGYFIGSYDIHLKHPDRILAFMEQCKEAGLVAAREIPHTIDPDYSKLLVESPTTVMMTYQMAEGENRTFNGHWTSAYFCAQRAA